MVYNQTFLKDKDLEGNNALHIACKQGCYQIAKLLISLKVYDLSDTNNDGKTAIDIVKENNEGNNSERESIQMLLENQ